VAKLNIINKNKKRNIFNPARFHFSGSSAPDSKADYLKSNKKLIPSVQSPSKLSLMFI